MPCVFTLSVLKEQMPKSNYSRYPKVVLKKKDSFNSCTVMGLIMYFVQFYAFIALFMLNKLVMSQDFNSVMIYSTRLHFGSVVDTVSLNPIDVTFGTLKSFFFPLLVNRMNIWGRDLPMDILTQRQRLHTVLGMNTVNLLLISLPGDLGLLSLTLMQQAGHCHG